MIEKIIAFCAYNKFITLFVIAALLVGGWLSIKSIPLDAVPDLSDTQVIIYSRWDRSPDIMEDQVTYPIVRSLLGAPKVKAIRGASDFGYSFVYVIFEDGTDIYWARSRVLEYLNKIVSQLPQGVKTEIGPDASGVGWVFQYALVDRTGQHDLAELRSYQDWNLRYELQSIQGVAEVATVGGFQKQYQITVNPDALLAYNIPLDTVIDAIRKGNNEVGARLLEFSGAEYMVRIKGYVKGIRDIENIVVAVEHERGTPILVKDIAKVAVGPEIRRGVADLDGIGDAVGGIVVMRHGENALNVIERVKARLKDIRLPDGVEMVTTYDRSELIGKSIETLTGELISEMIVVSLVILIFLLHIPSAMIPIFTLPIAVVVSFIPFYAANYGANIMSLGGIAIAIGAMVDAAIVVVENSHKRLEQWVVGGKVGDPKGVLVKAMQEVGRPAFYSLLIIAVSFLPIFALEAYEGRLFKPLAFTKTLAMAMAAVMAITLDPAMRMLLTRVEPYRFRPAWICAIVNRIFVGTIRSEERHPVSRFLIKLYHPACEFVLRHRKATIVVAFLLIISAIPVYLQIESEFMPSLNEGAILYMPTTNPGISVAEAFDLLQRQDKILKSFPEVERVFGKAGRADTSTDPAPFSMMETTVILKPESEWRTADRWYSNLPEFLKSPLRHIWPEHITWEELINEMNEKMDFPGTSNAWTMPIKARTDMLLTGVRTQVGIKILGEDLGEIEKIGIAMERELKNIKGTRGRPFAERVSGGYYVDFTLNDAEIARYGLSKEMVQMVLMSAVGGENITTTIEGRARYPVNIRYPRELRDDIEKLKRVLIPTPSGAQIPIGQLAKIATVVGPAMINNENGRLSGRVYADVDTSLRSLGSYVEEAKRVIAERVRIPSGYSLIWTGEYEHLERMNKRILVVLPITLLAVFLLLYMNTRSIIKTVIVLCAVPFSLIGAVWLLYLLGYHMSAGVWVGMIALMGIDAETGIFMLLFLDLSYYDRVRAGTMRTWADLKGAVIEGAVQRMRPKFMTVATTFIGLLPIMWSLGTGADVMKRIAAPMVGGLFTSFLMELLVYPAIYATWKWNIDMKRGSRIPLLDEKEMGH